jgi:hypothetical protein
MPSGHMARAEVQSHSFLTSALETGECSTSCPSHFTFGKVPCSPLTRLGGSWAGLDRRKKRGV